jgi:hypothetical protein
MRKDASASFFGKKEAKKRWPLVAGGAPRAWVTVSSGESFLLLFFKKEALPYFLTARTASANSRT